MVAVSLTPSDLEPFAPGIDPVKAQAMIDDAVALAVLLAPCLNDPDLDPVKAAAARAILRGAILRWEDAGSGAFTTQGAGPFSIGLDTRQPRKAMFWPSEIEQLQDICKDSDGGGAFSIDTIPASAPFYFPPFQ